MQPRTGISHRACCLYIQFCKLFTVIVLYCIDIIYISLKGFTHAARILHLGSSGQVFSDVVHCVLELCLAIADDRNRSMLYFVYNAYGRILAHA